MLINYFIHVLRQLLRYIQYHLEVRIYFSNYSIFSRFRFTEWNHTEVHYHGLNTEKVFELAWLICYICCGSFTVPSQRMNITEFVKRAYSAYFKLIMGDQNKSRDPHNVCKPWVENLRQWAKRKKETTIIWHFYRVVGAQEPCRWLLLLPHKNFLV